MAKHPTSSRVHREEKRPDDAFVNAIQTTGTWAAENARALIVFGVVAAVMVAVGIYWVTSQRRVETEAAARLGEVQQSAASGNAQLAIRDLRTYLETFGGTRAAREARLVLADLLISEDSAQQAASVLGKLGQDLDDPLGLAAARLQAAAYETMGQADQAVSEYVRIAAHARFTFQRREALANAARVRMQTGDPGDAVPYYEQVLTTFEPGENGRDYYVMWLAEARAQERADSTSAATPAAGIPAPAPDSVNPGG